MEMGDAAPAPADAPLAPPFGGGSANWGEEVEEAHEASGRNATVLEIEADKARKRAERFGSEYVEPKGEALARGLGMSRKEVLAMRKAEAIKKSQHRRGGGGALVTGFDMFDPAEEAKRAARAAKFGDQLGLTPEQVAIRQREAEERVERAKRSAAYAAVAAAGDLSLNVSGGDPQDVFETRVDPDLDAQWRADAVHLYGVDHMTTQECMNYFGEYGPVFVEWINDSSCNVCFDDEHTARRAIRMKGVAMGAGANPDERGALPEGTIAEMLWHSGPEFHKDGKTLALSFRLATEADVKPDGRIKSRQLWMKDGERRRSGGKRRRGGGGGDRERHHPYGGGGGGDSGGKRRRGRGSSRRGGMRGFDDDDDDGGVSDLRARIKAKKDAEGGGGGDADAAMDGAANGGGENAGGGDAMTMDGGGAAATEGKAAVGMFAAATKAAAATRVMPDPSNPFLAAMADPKPAPSLEELPETDLRKKLAASRAAAAAAAAGGGGEAAAAPAEAAMGDASAPVVYDDV